MRNSFCILFSFFLTIGFSQSNQTDSLRIQLKNAKHDTTRCKILNLLIESENNDNWPNDNQQLKEIAERNSKQLNELRVFYLEYYALSLSNFGYLSMQNGKNTEAYQYYHQALDIQKETNSKQGIAATLLNLGYLYRQDGNIAKAIDTYHSALKMQIETNDKLGMATSYNNIGFIFDNQGEYAQALEYYNKSLGIYTSIKDKDGIAICYGNIGYIYSIYGDPLCKDTKDKCLYKGSLKAIEYLTKAIKIQEEINDKASLANSFNVLAGVYDRYGDPECLKLNDDCKEKTRAKIFDYLQRALALRKEINNVSGIALSYNSLAEHALSQGDLSSALNYGQSGLKVSRDIGSPERIQDAALVLKNVFEKLHKPQEALDMYELYIQMKDSIYNEETKKSAIKKSFQIEYEKKSAADSVKVAEEKKITTLQLKQEKTQRFALYGGLTLVALFGGFMFNRFKVTQKQKYIIEKQKEIVDEKQLEILDSIHYAKRIQNALMANADFINEHLQHNFILFQPKDIVSGDFYWAAEHNNKFYLAACDSTGHGVPGAFMSLLNMGFLSEAIKEKNIARPNEIFDYVRQRLITSMSNEGQKDGMDGILICYDKTTNILEYSAANNEPILIRNNEVIELAKDRMPIGKGEKTIPFTLHTIELKSGDSLYLYTDGYADQFGGAKGKKFKYKQLNDLLLSLKDTQLIDQKSELELAFTNWKGNQEQVDDVLIIGIKI